MYQHAERIEHERVAVDNVNSQEISLSRAANCAAKASMMLVDVFNYALKSSYI